MPKVLAFVADPARLHERFGWDDPTEGVRQATADLNLGLEESGFRYDLTTEEIPIPPFGHRNPDSSRTGINEVNTSEPIFMTPAEWELQWRLLGWQPDRWPGGGNLHLKWFIENHIRPRVNDYDEFWLAGLPMPAAFEGGMLAPEWDLAAPRVGVGSRPFSVAPAVSCTMSLPKGERPISLDWLKSYRTHDTLVNVPGISKRYVWHMFQVSNFNPVHNFAHRTEAILNHIWGSGWNGYQEQWDGPVAPSNLRSYNELFGNTDNTYPGLGFAGSCHFLVNAKGGYWYDMDDVVPSGAHLFKDFPNGFPIDLTTIQQKMRLVSRKDWAGLHDPLIWWLQQLPRNSGKTDDRWNNWLKYILDVNDETGRGRPTTRPVVGAAPPLPGVFTRYDDRVLVRWQPHDGDGHEQLYSIWADDTPRLIYRRGENHVRLSLDVPVARESYTIRGDSPNQWEQPWTEGVPTEESKMNLQQIEAVVRSLHETELKGCPAPATFRIDSNQVWVYLEWPGISPPVMVSTFYDEPTLRETYVRIFNNRPELKALCGGAPPPTPTPTPTPQKLTLARVKEIVAGLHTTNSLINNCPPPPEWREEATVYRALWPALGPGADLDIGKDWTEANVVAFYPTLYHGRPVLKAACGSAPPPPGPGPGPTPPPPGPSGATLKEIARVKAAALKAELAVWEREL